MIHGSIVALVTPLTARGAIDYPALTRLIEWHIASKTHAILVTGTTGESATLTPNEKHGIIEHTLATVNGRIPVLAGTGCNATEQSISKTALAKSIGVDAVLLVSPYYNKPTQAGLIAHFRALADGVDVPQILYNVPGRTVISLEAETVTTLSQHPNIIGIKETTGDMARFKHLQQHCSQHFRFYSGDDISAQRFMQEGGHGVISVTANVAPKAVSQMCDAALNDDHQLAQAIDQKLQALHDFLFVESNPIPVKAALAHMGKINNVLRLPLTTLSAQHHNRLREITEQLQQQTEQLDRL
jgi:4-hydroxy-tetrahydrodipicolinate synthase